MRNLTLLSESYEIDLSKILGLSEEELEKQDSFVLNRFRSIANMVYFNSPFFVYQGGLLTNPSRFCELYNSKVLSVRYISGLYFNNQEKVGNDEYDFWLLAGGSCLFDGSERCHHTFDPISRELAKQLLSKQRWPKIDLNTGHFTYHQIDKIIERIKLYFSIS